jgi:hypothetical protein
MGALEDKWAEKDAAYRRDRREERARRKQQAAEEDADLPEQQSDDRRRRSIERDNVLLWGGSGFLLGCIVTWVATTIF